MKVSKTYVFLIIIGLSGCFALTAQLYLMLENRIQPLAESLIRFFSYFTILTNLLVTVYSLIVLIVPNSAPGKFFLGFKTVTALTVYIVVVGLVYNIVLRSIWDPQGLQLVVDELLHSIIPGLFLVYWFVSAPGKKRLVWNDVWLWLLYPLGYSIFVLIRGSFSDFYPYPFIDVAKLGINQVAINSGIVTLVFLFLSFLFIALTRRAQPE